MPIFFANSGLIDLDVIRIMGVSVKPHPRSIGYFGTGLKYALAVLLRTGHEVTLTRGGEKFSFTARDYSVREKSVKRLYMNDEALPFTTDLGKGWQVWMAFRELFSNARDENGQISDEPLEGDTIFEVAGAAIEREYIDRNNIFLFGPPIAGNKEVEVFEGPSKAVFYRGVKTFDLPNYSLFRYNILTTMALTEDRTFRSEYDTRYTLASRLPELTHRGIFTQLLKGNKFWDQQLAFDEGYRHSPEFLEVVDGLRPGPDTAPALSALKTRFFKKEEKPLPILMTQTEQSLLERAFSFLPALDCSLQKEEVEVVESLGPEVFGALRGRQIYLARGTLTWGLETVVATLYEEWLHKAHNFKDESRALQNFLLQKLASIAINGAA